MNSPLAQEQKNTVPFYFVIGSSKEVDKRHKAAAHRIYDALVASGVSEKESINMIEQFHSDAYCDGCDDGR